MTGIMAETKDDFSARHVAVSRISQTKFEEIRAWCDATYGENNPDLTLSGYSPQFEKWTIRAVFDGPDAIKNAALFRVFWG